MSAALDVLRRQIEGFFEYEVTPGPPDELLLAFRIALNCGEIRAAAAGPDGIWSVNEWVKKGILLHARHALLRDVSAAGQAGTHFDYHTLPNRSFHAGDRIRVCAGSFVRDGTYFASGVTVMPGSFIDIGAWIGEGTVIDSHASIGLCAQIGAHVQISCGTHIGGVLQPLSSLPCVVMDGVTIGGNCGIYDGVMIGEGAVIAAGTNISGHSRVFDFRRKAMFRAGSGEPLVIPPEAVILPGARPLMKGPAKDSGLLLQVPVMIGRRSEVDLNGDLLSELMD